MKNTVINFAAATRLPLLPGFSERYEVIEYLASGKQSDTFVVRSRESGGYLLAKLYQKSPGSDGEEVIIAQLDHPAIPKPADVIKTAGMVCVIREYVEGLPLDKLTLPWDERRALDIGVQLCDILSYLHSRTPPVIHRDIKPQNVIIGDDHKVHLIDFGISRRFSDDAAKDTALVVTEGYAPPEQYGFKQTDCRADIYSLGILLCFLLTGKRELDALSGLANRRLARVIRKCAEFAPKDRYPTADAVKRALLDCAKKRVRGAWLAAALVPPVAAAALMLWPPQGQATPPEVDASAPPASGEPSGINAVVPPVREGIVFAEPLIEQAVRVVLGLDGDAALTEYDLARVAALYIGCDKAFDSFREYWSYGEFSHGPLNYIGPITTLEDLRMMPSIERLYIFNQPLTDLGPLSELTKLRVLELEHIPVSDLSPLEGLDSLEEVNLSFGTFTDLSPLTRLPNLTKFHILACPNIDVRQVRDFRSLRELTILHPEYGKDHYKYLPDIPLELLKIEESAIDSFEWFSFYKPSLRTLHINRSGFSSLEGIEGFTQLQKLVIVHTKITDLTPLLSLPNLTEVQIDSSMRDAADAIRDRAGFEIMVE